MQLSFLASNIIGNVLNRSNSLNIVYEPKNSLIDHIIFTLPHNFYLFNNNRFNFSTDNVIDLPERLYGINSYNLALSYSLEKFTNHNNISSLCHIPAIVLIDETRPYKKEDRHIINEKTKNITKIFLSQDSFETMGKPVKSFVVPIGIPNMISSSLPRADDLNHVLLLDNNSMSQQIKKALHSLQITCNILPTNINIEKIKDIFSQHKFCIDLTNQYSYNLLAAVSAGCTGITLKNNPVICPYIHHADTVEDILSFIIDQQKVTTNIADQQEYINKHYSYEIFIKQLTAIINTTSKEVFLQ
jgi:hypothetical protein